MVGIPMKGEERWDPVEAAQVFDEELPRMLRDALRYRQIAAEEGEDLSDWDRQLAKIDQLCRQRGIDPAPIHAEFGAKDGPGSE